MNRCNGSLARRFVDEDLAIHWRVDDTKESFNRLLYHLEVKSNFKPYFEQALHHLGLEDARVRDELVIADIGAGVSWTSAILTHHPKVKLVYAVEPSDIRLKHARFVVRHFKGENKVKLLWGTFSESNVPEKVDLALLCGSLHHCYDAEIPGLFSNIKRLLKPCGRVLIANEHYVNWVWSLKRMLSYLYHFSDRRKLYYSLRNSRAPAPFDGEHWRTRSELEKIFKENGFMARFYVHEGDLCKDKPSLYRKLGWFYYHAILWALKDVNS